MGKIHEIQAELVEVIRERNRALAEVERWKGEAEDFRGQRDKLLAERPAPVKADWKMPTAACVKCGGPIRPEAYTDVDEIYLSFSEECEHCDAPFAAEEHEAEFDWPFECETAWPGEFERLGFDVV